MSISISPCAMHARHPVSPCAMHARHPVVTLVTPHHRHIGHLFVPHAISVPGHAPCMPNASPPASPPVHLRTRHVAPHAHATHH
eukprot:scaffold6550_cov131-Isochrysis_galbana.AAC.1